MKLTQISVFLENRKGRLCDVGSLLGNHGINIRALTIAESPEFGILRMVVDKPKDAVDILKRKGFIAKLTDIVAVEVDDRPGGLAQVLQILYDNSINVEYMYGFVEKFSDRALLVFRFDSPDKAISVLKKNKINIVGAKAMESI
ncbi:MAG: ACT domain-containing protein [Candidatus Omnitrophica bacterium]|nr:ACT domain-containing protein [Candidatus Omnitrophota bacterium]